MDDDDLVLASDQSDDRNGVPDTFRRCVFLFSDQVQHASYFMDLCRVIYMSGGLCLQDQRFTSVDRMLSFANRRFFVGCEVDMKRTFKKYDLIGIDQLELLEPGAIYKLVDKD